MMTVTEAAKRWGCSRQNVLYLLNAGLIPRARRDSTKIVDRTPWLIPENAARPARRKTGPKPK